jgi:hypothetical protein
MRQILETEDHVAVPPMMYADPFYRITYLIKEEIRVYKWFEGEKGRQLFLGASQGRMDSRTPKGIRKVPPRYPLIPESGSRCAGKSSSAAGPRSSWCCALDAATQERLVFAVWVKRLLLVNLPEVTVYLMFWLLALWPFQFL